MAFIDSSAALIRAVATEFGKKTQSPLHAILHISEAFGFLLNGLRCCRIQIECNAGCGYLVEAFGDEADALHGITIDLKELLSELQQDSTSESISQEEADHRVLHLLNRQEVRAPTT